ncbi:BspA family leucine-rich repeat surface protein [Ruminococcus sp.]|uniref:BspA family leucine-rich repeat surface protein n=1 Tax=Ruminococcus sp. TaxID=41978 RepID=UPI0025D60901|nr:BspA family leucine-rich repeat surface protein [Ruminococcus sp.]
MMINKHMKKMVAALLAVTLVNSAVNAPLSGKTLFDSFIVNAAELSCSFDVASGTLTISGDLSDYFAKKQLEQALNDYNEEKIIAEKGTVFSGVCNNLFSYSTAKSIDLSKVDTSGVTDMSAMFSNCSDLVSLDISGFDTSNVNSMGSMFYGCSSLKSLDTSSFDTSNVEFMNSMFSKCSSLESIDLTNFNTGKLTFMSGMFMDCTALSSLNISSFDTSNVKYMYWMFQNCSSLKTLDLSKFDTSNVLEMNSMFENCSSLESLDLSNFKTPKTSRMENMFNGCTSLKKLNISNLDTSNVTKMYYMFYNCKSLESLDLSSFDTSNVEEMFSMFEGCSSLKSLNISSFDTSNVKSMSYMFRNCSSLEKIDLTGFITSNVSSFSCMFEGCTNLSYTDFSNFDTSKSDGTAYMFSGCTALKPYINTAVGQSFSLNGNIEANIYIQPCENLAKAVVSGPNGDLTITDFSNKEADGTLKLTYPVNAAQGSEKIVLKTYDKENRQLILCNFEDSLSSYSQIETSVHQYLKKITYTNEYRENEKLAAIVDSLDNYCNAAENYFNGTDKTVNGISSINKDSLPKELVPEIGEDIKISLVLNSATAVRIYTNSSNVKIDGIAIDPHTSNYGKYYEISNISAYKLLDEHTVNINGTEYKFRPLSYVYRVLNNNSASTKLNDMAKATYVYARAAKAYMGKENDLDQEKVIVEEDKWHIGYNWNENVSYYLYDSVFNNDSDYSIVIDNTELNHCYLEKKFIVEPNSQYRFSAMVKCSGFLGESSYNSSGASIGKVEGVGHSEYVTDDEWTGVEYCFSTGNENEIVLFLSNGMYGSVCKGTAYFSNIRLEKVEGEVTNKWDILAVVYQDVNAEVTMDGKNFVYTDHLYDQDIDYINYQLSNLYNTFPELSNNLMGINSIDVHIEDSPLTELNEKYGNGLCIDPHSEEIESKLESYLKEKNYDQILIFAPISDVADGWWGLGGTTYRNNIDFCQFGYWSRESYEDEKSKPFAEAVVVHEMLHGIERRSFSKNPDKTVGLHDAEEYGFTDDGDNWKKWYTAYMRAELDGGKGIDPDVYQVLKNIRYILISDNMTVNNDEIKSKS